MSSAARSGSNPQDLGDLERRDAAARRAIYYMPNNSFTNHTISPVPIHRFERERDIALAPDMANREILLDLPHLLGCSHPATTPNLLARYLKLAPGGSLGATYAASGEVYYAIAGAGETLSDGESFRWAAGDVFVLPSGGENVHRAAVSESALLYVVTDEPLLRSLFGTNDGGAQKLEVAHYPAHEIAARMGQVFTRAGDGDTLADTVFFTSERMSGTMTTTPTISSNINTVEIAGDQRSHSHNAAALTLCLQSEGGYSQIDGVKIPWLPFGVMLTPPNAVHSHHNRGPARLTSFVVQDSGLYYRSRTTGFQFADFTVT